LIGNTRPSRLTVLADLHAFVTAYESFKKQQRDANQRISANQTQDLQAIPDQLIEDYQEKYQQAVVLRLAQYRHIVVDPKSADALNQFIHAYESVRSIAMSSPQAAKLKKQFDAQYETAIQARIELGRIPLAELRETYKTGDMLTIMLALEAHAKELTRYMEALHGLKDEQRTAKLAELKDFYTVKGTQLLADEVKLNAFMHAAAQAKTYSGFDQTPHALLYEDAIAARALLAEQRAAVKAVVPGLEAQSAKEERQRQLNALSSAPGLTPTPSRTAAAAHIAQAAQAQQKLILTTRAESKGFLADLAKSWPRLAGFLASIAQPFNASARPAETKTIVVQSLDALKSSDSAKPATTQQDTKVAAAPTSQPAAVQPVGMSLSGRR